MAYKSVENNGGLMAEGDYECVLVACCETVTKTSGAPVVKFDFQVRSDVEQSYQRKHIFKNFYQDENGAFDGEKIGRFACSLGVPKGEDFELDDLVGRCCILHMSRFTPKDGGEEREVIRYTAPTKAGQMVQGAPRDAQSGLEIVPEEDLPF